MKKGACIINTASINADMPNPPLLAYATTKGAIQNFNDPAGCDPENLVARGDRARSSPSPRREAMTKERTKLDAALAPPGAQTVLPRLLRRVQAQEPAHHGRVAGLGMGIDLEHQFFLPILAYLVRPPAARCLPHFPKS